MTMTIKDVDGGLVVHERRVLLLSVKTTANYTLGRFIH